MIASSGAKALPGGREASSATQIWGRSLPWSCALSGAGKRRGGRGKEEEIDTVEV